MPSVFTRSQKSVSQPKPVLLAERMQWYAAKLRPIHGLLADDLSRDARTVAQLEAALADTRQLLAERDATIARLNDTIRRLGGGSR